MYGVAVSRCVSGYEWATLILGVRSSLCSGIRF